MSVNQVDIEEIYQKKEDYTWIDVRSPAEYLKGHLPNSNNIPLFSDEERAEVGTLYKQKGQETAIGKGLDMAGKKLNHYLSSLRSLNSSKKIAMYCWRGGKRSASMAWLFGFNGYDVHVVKGGYKSYRSYANNYFADSKLNLIVLGGKTGSGKTLILKEIQRLGEQFVDLEGIANHKGSAFGDIGEQNQPTTEQFENDLFEKLAELDPGKRVWIENESQSIGRVYVPIAFWSTMKSAPLLHLEIPIDERIRFLQETYGNFDSNMLINAFQKIEKRIGSQALKNAVEAIESGELSSAIATALKYYDKTYMHGLRTNIAPYISILPFQKIDPIKVAETVIRYANNKNL